MRQARGAIDAEDGLLETIGSDPIDAEGPLPSGPSRAKMARAELMGSHTHHTIDGVGVHVWLRDGKYLARGRYQGQAFGETIGDNVALATARLRQLLTEIEDGGYVRP